MHKDELIHLHSLLYDIQVNFDNDECSSEKLDEYKTMNTGPTSIDCSKSEHKRAIFKLGEIIADSMTESEYSDRGRIRARMNELAEEAV
ncbi:MAG: UPF0058 family protein [Halobacteria archaeon]